MSSKSLTVDLKFACSFLATQMKKKLLVLSLTRGLHIRIPCPQLLSRCSVLLETLVLMV